MFALALRTVLSSSKEEWDLFSKIFELFWSHPQNAVGPESKESKEPRFNTHTPGESSRALLGLSGGDASQSERESKAVLGVSAQQRLQKVDLADVPVDDLLALEQISMRLFRKMSLRLARRRKIKNLGACRRAQNHSAKYPSWRRSYCAGFSREKTAKA